MKLILVIWLVVALLDFLLLSNATVYRDKLEERPTFTGCFTLVYALLWPITIPHAAYLAFKEMRGRR